MKTIETNAFQTNWEVTYRYVARHSPYYRELFRRSTRVPQLQDVRTVDKSILSQRNLDFLCVSREKIVEVVTTSGTTGKPLLWMMTDSDMRRLAMNERASFECAGLTNRDTVLVAVAMDRCFIAGLAYWLGLRELGCAAVRVGASSSMLLLETIERAQPTAIVAVPSFLRQVAETANARGFDLKSKRIAKAVCIGETVRDRALGLNASGRAIEAAWGSRVYSSYGVTELANSLCECDEGVGGHLHDAQLHIEVLDDESKPVAEGEVGEIVATTFGVEAMPLIRYRTGDCAALFGAPWACGRMTPRLGPIVGRKGQKLKLKGVSLFPSTLAAVLEQSAGVESFVIIARHNGGLSDTIEVLVHGGASLSSLREAMRARARVVPQVRYATREEIETLQMPEQTRKRRTFVDLR